MTDLPHNRTDSGISPRTRTLVELTDASIDVARLVAAVESPRAGAVVFFLGTTRQFTDGQETTALDYEAYREMALAKLHELADQAAERWPLVASALVHRLGRVPIGQASVAIAVSTPHRASAFEAARWLITTLKQVVPIWKQETRADGTSEWIHPGAPGAESGTQQ